MKAKDMYILHNSSLIAPIWRLQTHLRCCAGRKPSDLEDISAEEVMTDYTTLASLVISWPKILLVTDTNCTWLHVLRDVGLETRRLREA
jgi:hypothetical protein